MIKGVIFDFDGLIFDTETLQYNILQDIFLEHGTDLPLSVWQQEVGTFTGFSPFHYLDEQVKRKTDHAVLEEQFSQTFNAKLAQGKARDGVKEYLQTAKDLDLKIGLASSSSFKWVSTHLRNLDLFNFFECIRTSDDVKSVKPDPELYLQAANCLGLVPEECLVFEDSAHGAMAAKRAGMDCVIVPNEITQTMEFCEVNHRISSMTDTDLQTLIHFVQTNKILR